SLLWEESQDGVLHGDPQDNRQADGGEAEEDSAGAAKTLARCDGEHGEVARVSGSRIFPIPRGTASRGATEDVSTRSAAHVVMAASTAESTHPLDVENVSGETGHCATGSRTPAP